MQYETKYDAEQTQIEIFSDNKQRVSRNTNQSETSNLSDTFQDRKKIENCLLFSNTLHYKKFFSEKIKQTQVTPNLHKKAINWLITFCWTRNYSEQILWYSVGYYYSYTYSILVKKERLNLILISCTNLALKLCQNDSFMSFDTMKNLLNGVWAVKDFSNIQAQLVQLFEFELYFQTLLCQILSQQRSEQESHKTLFLAQMLFMNNYDSAINDLLLEDILVLINSPENENYLRLEIIKLHKNPKTLDPLKQKFSSKFNVDEFLKKILKQI